MLIDNNNFSSANFALNKQVHVTVGMSLDLADTNVVYATSDVHAKYPTGANVLNDTLRNVDGVSQRVTPEKAISEIGNLKFEVIDPRNFVKDGEFGAGDWTTVSGDVTIDTANRQATYGGGAATLAQTNNRFASGDSCIVRFGIRGRTAGSIRIDLGGTNGTLQSADGYHTQTIVAGAGGSITFEEQSGFDGSVYGLSISKETESGTLTELIEDAINTDGDGMRRARVQVWVGYGTMIWADYELRHTFFVDRPTYRDSVYTIDASDAQRFARKDVFDVHTTTLKTDITATQTHIPVHEPNKTDTFFLVDHDGGYSDAPNTAVCYVKIKDEIIRCGDHPTLGNASTALFTHTTDGISLHVLARGALSSSQAAVDLNSGADNDRQPKIEEVVYLEGPAIKILRSVMDGTLIGQGADTTPAHWHADMPAAYIRAADFTGIGVDLYDSTSPADGSDPEAIRLRFIGIKKQDAKRFIEREILLWIGGYMPVYASGEIGLKRFTQVLNDADYVAELNNETIAAYGELEHSLPDIINTIQVDWNFNHLEKAKDDQYTKSNVLIDTDSIAIWGKANTKRFVFRGVATAVNNDENLRTHFDTFRSRHAGPPLRLTLRVFHRFNVLEVGDIVRVNLSQIRDIHTGTGLDRSFEVQKSSTDWVTGAVNLTLFGSSQAAGAITESVAASHLANTWYTSQGATDLDVPLNISGGNIISNGNLTAGDYFYLGNLQLNSGVTITINGTVRIFVRGFFTQLGSFDGVGRGENGGNGQTLYTNNATQGVVGYVGSPSAGGGLRHTNLSQSTQFIGEKEPNPGVAWSYAPALGALPEFALTINAAGTSLTGLPTKLTGSGGPGGIGTGDYGSTLNANGGAGGDGGAGLLIIARGMSFGASADIDTSGANGSAGQASVSRGDNYWAGDGGGGAPGGFVLLLDGDSTPPNAVARRTASHGASVIRGTRDERTTGSDLLGWLLDEIPDRSSWYFGTQAHTQINAQTKIQFIPEPIGVEEEVIGIVQIATPSAPTITKTSELQAVGPAIGNLIASATISWTVTTDAAFSAYEIQARRTSAAAWRTVAIVSDSTVDEVSINISEGEEWESRLRILSVNNGGDSEWSIAGNQIIGYSARGLFKQLQYNQGPGGSNYGLGVDMARSGLFCIAGAPTGADGLKVNLMKKRGIWEVVNETILSPATTAGNWGHAVSIAQNGQRFMVGDWADTENGAASGRHVIYSFLDGVFTIEHNVAGSAGEGRGESVAINKDDGIFACVGASRYNNGAANDGRIHIYKRTGTAWAPYGASPAPINGPASGQRYFGHVVRFSADGSTLAVLATDFGLGTDGRVYIYRDTGTAFTERDTFDVPEAGLSLTTRDALTISDDGTYIAVASPNHPSTPTEGGVHILKETTTDTWTLQQTIEFQDVSNPTQFGKSLAFGPGDAPTRIAAGASDWHSADHANVGQVQIWDRQTDSEVWTLIQAIETLEPFANQLFGSSVAMSHDTLIVGSVGGSSLGGGVYWFEAVNILEA